MAGVFAYADDEMKKKLASQVILVVDDEPEIRALVRDVLGEAGINRIFEAQNGKEAIELIDAGFDIFSLVICDWNMPSMTGIEFLKQVRTTHPGMPFLMVTGRSDKNSVIDAKRAGVSAYIRKPFSPRQLEEKLKVLLMRGSAA